MGEYVAGEVIRLMVRNGINPVRSRILVLGLAFKENCPDLRNTRVVDILAELRSYNARVDVHDPPAVYNFYMKVWRCFYLQYLLLPFLLS